MCIYTYKHTQSESEEISSLKVRPCEVTERTAGWFHKNIRSDTSELMCCIKVLQGRKGGEPVSGSWVAKAH